MHGKSHRNKFSARNFRTDEQFLWDKCVGIRIYPPSPREIAIFTELVDQSIDKNGMNREQSRLHVMESLQIFSQLI